MREHHDTVIIGGGQAGLAMSSVLSREGREHVVFERHRVGERWRTERWDSLRFQFPNWSLQLPGFAYSGDEPDGFAHFTQISEILEKYAADIDAPVRESTEVVALEGNGERGGFMVTTRDGSIGARRVVLATGPFQQPMVPQLAQNLPPWVHQTDPTRYRDDADLPPGAVLVVGSGASGYQIADELHQAGRSVYLSVSRHRHVPRRFRGKDVYWWLEKLGRFSQTIDSMPSREWPPSTIVTGVNGGYDVDVRRLSGAGVHVVGRTVDLSDGTISFDASANEVLDEADQAFRDFVSLARTSAQSMEEELADEDTDAESAPLPNPIEFVDSVNLTKANVRTVIWATGYTYDYDWVRLPVFDSRGRPVQHRGISDHPGLYFLGLHWMHTFKSGLFAGVGSDAEHLAEHIARLT